MTTMPHLRLGIAGLLFAASCGGGSNTATGTTMESPSPSAPTTQPTPRETDDETTTTVATTAPIASSTSDVAQASTSCREGAIPDLTERAPATTEPAEILDEPGWVRGLREPRIVDGTYLISDLERAMGQTAPLVLPPGEYPTDSLGGIATLALDEAWRLMRADPGLLVFAGADEPLLQDRPVLFIGRPQGITQPEAASSTVDQPADQTALITVPDDLRTWFDVLDAVVVDGCSPFEFIGEEAVVYDVRIDPEAGDTNFCMPVGRCVTSFVWHTSGPNNDTTVHLSDRYAYRIWHVPHEQGPLVAVAMAPPEELDHRATRSARLLTALDADLGELSSLPADAFGHARGVAGEGALVPLSLDDLHVELETPAWAALFARSFIAGRLDGPPPWQGGPYGEVFAVDTATAGPVATVDDAIAELERVARVEERQDELMLGRPSTVVTVTADEATRVFRRTTAPPGTTVEETGFGWWWVEPGPQVLWLVPIDDGLLAVAAIPGDDGDLDAAVEFTRSIFGNAEVAATD